MITQMELAFESSATIPTELFERDELLPFRAGLEAMDAADNAYPVEGISIKNGVVYLRGIERGVWLWGVSWSGRNNGEGFYPFRRWGIEYAAVSREAAFEAARQYIAQRTKP